MCVFYFVFAAFFLHPSGPRWICWCVWKTVSVELSSVSVRGRMVLIIAMTETQGHGTGLLEVDVPHSQVVNEVPEKQMDGHNCGPHGISHSKDPILHRHSTST